MNSPKCLVTTKVKSIDSLKRGRRYLRILVRVLLLIGLLLLDRVLLLSIVLRLLDLHFNLINIKFRKILRLF